MTDNKRHGPVRSNNKIFLAGRIVHVSWNDTEAPSETLQCIFANDAWVRFARIPGEPGYTGNEEDDEFLTPSSNIWRITSVKARA